MKKGEYQTASSSFVEVDKTVVVPGDIVPGTLQVTEFGTPSNWRATLTVDEANMVAEARATAERWAGAQNNSPLILIDKLVKLLDGKVGDGGK